jgi:exopolysaccharide biosynthesis WecB/TagA/CpsF family protein
VPATIQILGLRFFVGDAEGAIDYMGQVGGVLIAPSGTCFARLQNDSGYREAVTHAEMALPDSGAMVLLWRLFRRQKITRISGLTYIGKLTEYFVHHRQDRVLWVLPNEAALSKTVRWLEEHDFRSNAEDFYVAPIYGGRVEDVELVSRIQQRRPDHVVIAIGSGPQEKLGVYLRDNLPYRPAIHCIGAALGFLTGDQVAIPSWADRLYLGWMFRLFAQPRIFIPRLARAAVLPLLIARYGSELPPLRAQREATREDGGRRTEN